MRIIVVTGSIATGKSTVSKYLLSQGLPLIDSDQLARLVVAPGSPGLAALAAHFGAELLDSEGQLQRAKLAEIIFQDEAAKAQVNQLLHPLIGQEIRKAIANYAQAGHERVFVDIPLYYESEVDLGQAVDQVWLVYTTSAIQVERLMERNQISKAAAENLIRNQISIEDKHAWADVILDNQGEIKDLYRQVDQELQKLGIDLSERDH